MLRNDAHTTYIQNDVGVYRQPRCIESEQLVGVADTMKMSELRKLMQSRAKREQKIDTVCSEGGDGVSIYLQTYLYLIEAFLVFKQSQVTEKQ